MAQAAQRSKPKSAVFKYFSATSDGKHFVCQCAARNGNDEEEICGSRLSSYSSDGKQGPT